MKLNIKKMRSLPRVLDKKERIFFYLVTSISLISLIVFLFSTYLSKTEKVATFGGSYTEAMVGAPRFLNPIYSSTSDVDRDITSLLFSSLMTYDFSEGFSPALIESFTEEEAAFKIKLRDGLKWSDGESLTAEDLVFTIKAIQDPEYRSPLRPDWLGVEVEQISDLEVILKLEQPSVTFINKLNLKIIPAHIWKDVSPSNFPLSRYNLDPVGSGPYRLKELVEDREGRITSLALEPNPYYWGKEPYISKFSILFFDSEDEILSLIRDHKVDGFAKTNPKDYRQISARVGFKVYRFQLPRYFALFFNLENKKIDQDVRTALNLAIDKDSIIESALTGRGVRVDSILLDNKNQSFNLEESKKILDEIGLKMNGDFRSTVARKGESLSFTKDLNTGSQGEEVRKLQKCLIYLTEEDPDLFPEKTLSGFYGQDTRQAVIRFQEKYRKEILDPSGFSQGTGMVAKSTRAKLNELCSDIPELVDEMTITIKTINQPLMVQTAELVKEYWESVGIKTEIATYDRSSLERDVIKPRDYEVLLFGEAYEAIPDIFPFWHSSQKSQFGLNLTMYDNEKCDKLIEQSRVESNKEDREFLMQKIEELISQEIPAIFLYNPDYLFFASPRISGVSPRTIVNPSDRFNGVEDWYIKTKRIVKR